MTWFGKAQLLSLERLTLAGVAHRCAQESELFFRRESNDPRFCFELFRRAILGRNREAWELIYTQYYRLVARWVARHPGFPSTGEETQFYVNRAFERMWSALTPDKFRYFPDLKYILRYLQMCVHSVIVDNARIAQRHGPEVSLESLPVEVAIHNAPVEEEALAQVQHQALWDSLRSRLHDKQEWIVMYGSFVLDLKPKELLTTYQGTFQDVAEVYRVKQNVLDRLRRDAELAELFSAKS